jgi:ATP-dependent RNA helicase DDX27
MFDPLLVQVVSENEDETLQSSESDDDLGFSLDFITTQNITQLNDNIKININTINDNVEIDKNELYDPFNDKSSDDDIDMIDRQEDTVKQKEKVSDYFCLPTTAPVSTDFSRLSLSRPILKAVGVLGWTTATPIQASAIPLGLQGRDLCASAQTGSGKTAAFMIPVLERLLFRQRNVPTTRVLVLVPTRELASQVMDVTRSLAQFSKVMISLCVGNNM